jgi:hypothetical protein
MRKKRGGYSRGKMRVQQRLYKWQRLKIQIGSAPAVKMMLYGCSSGALVQYKSVSQ